METMVMAKEQRTEKVTVRLTPRELEYVRSLADDYNMTTAEVLQKLIWYYDRIEQETAAIELNEKEWEPRMERVYQMMCGGLRGRMPDYMCRLQENGITEEAWFKNEWRPSTCLLSQDK